MASNFESLFGNLEGSGGFQLPAENQSMALTLAETTPAPPPTTQAIDKLKPGSELHTKTLGKLTAMLKFSNDKISSSFPRFRNQEMKVQSYLMSQDYREIVDAVENSRGAEIPEPVHVVVPYTYATLHSAATFIGSVLLGTKPLFPLAAARATHVDSSRHMEQVLQSNIDQTKGQEKLFQHIWDSLLFGYSPVKIGWERVLGKTMRMGMNGQREFATDTKFEGNCLTTIDPYNFRPDPRVPMHECHRKGDFMMDLSEVSYTVLRDMEARDELKYVKQALHKARMNSTRRMGDNDRRSYRNSSERTPHDVIGFAEVAEATVRLSPKDWGLGDETESELWRFLFLPDIQIISAAPLGAMHEEHPFAVGEPTSLGHDFLSMSQADMISVFQDLLSWLVSSRMENVRASIANSYVVDPSRVEMNDIASSAIGRIIRMKQSAVGLPIKEAIMQLQVNDVTGGHFSDISVIRNLADAATGVNDNLRGLQSQGGRRSATEARMSMQAGASRLSQLATRLSGQSFYTIASQMISNTQQWMPDNFWIELTGDEGAQSRQVKIEDLVGSFNYQISDGSLPLDRGAMLESWKEVLAGVAMDPELRQTWDVNEIFRHIALLGGAKNIDQFKRQQQPTIAPPGVDPAAEGQAMPGRPAAPQLPASLAFSG